MPNWCYTNIVFHGTENEINDFHEKLSKWTSEIIPGNDFGRYWLGNILINAGLGDRIDAGVNCLRCRGRISWIDDIDTDETESVFKINTETAWAPMMGMWQEVIKTLGYQTIGFSFEAEEPGCELYQIYDPYGDFPERYYVDVYLEDEDCDNEAVNRVSEIRYFEDDGLLRTALQSLFDEDIEMSLEALIEKTENYQFKNEDSYITIHKYEILDEYEIY